MTRARTVVWTLTFAMGVSIAQSRADDPHSHAQSYGPKLGSVEFPVSCRDATRAYINEGLALLHHMTYTQARDAFREITPHEIFTNSRRFPR